MALATTVLAASAATNPFFEYKNWKTPHGTYPFNEIYAEHYMPAFEEAMKRGLQEIDEIVNNPAAPTFANTIEAYEASGEMLSIVAGCFYNLTSAETNDSLQQIEIELSPKMSEYSATIRLNEGLFKRIKAVYDQKDKLKLNKAQVKLLEDIYDSFANNGANLSAEDKQTYQCMDDAHHQRDTLGRTERGYQEYSQRECSQERSRRMDAQSQTYHLYSCDARPR